ncbi:crooked legs [Carabus blaptoides fortunei]
MVDMKNSLVNMQTKENNRENNTLSVQTTSEDSEGVSMYSISLNQWDLFETKFTCRCVKEFNSFTEETRHLCKNCEGGLLGFRLSKIKVGLAQDKYSLTDELNKSLDSSTGSVTSESSNSNRKVDQFNDSANSELGFDYNDILLCKVHVNGVKKQINSLRSIIYTEYNHTTIDKDIKNGLDSHSDNPSDSDCSETPNSSFEEEKTHNNSSEMVSISDKPYQCKLCSKGYTRRYNLISHYASHAEAELYDCAKCKKKFMDCEERDQHELTHKKSVKHMSIETTPTATKTNIRKSITSDNEEVNMEIDELNVKLELNSTDENITCGTCDRSFSHKSNLAIHLMTHMGKQEFKCDTCSKQFFRKDNYDQHVLMHTTPRKFDCPQCGRSFTQKSNMHRHYRNHAIEKFICSICTKCFARKDILERHILTHAESTERMYQCTQCDRSYNYPQNLKKHMRKHIVPVFKCTTCDAEFNQKELLEEHINQHKANKSYCSICDRIFSKTTNMKRHRMRHTNDVVFTCETCNKTFRSEFNLKQHSLAHNENVERFECTHCNKTYASKSGLTRHIFSHAS